MKHTHTEGLRSILKSRFASGVLPLMVALFACALAAPEARAEVLVYEGFSSADYTATSDYTASSLNGKKSDIDSIGLDTENGWNSGTGVFVAQPNGLQLPDIWKDGTVHGTKDLRAVLYNTTATSATRDNRAQQRKLTCTWPTSGSIYFRFLMQVPKAALSTSYLGNWNYWIAGLGTEAIEKPTTGNECNVVNGIYMGVRNRNGTLEVAAYVKNPADGATFTKPLFTIDTSKTLRCACIAKIDIGENGNDTLSFYAAPTNTLTTDFEWTVTTNGISLVSGSAKPSYLQMIGHYKVNSQYITFDEFIVTTDQAEAYAHIAPNAPHVTVGTTSVANVTTASADISATIGMQNVASATPSVAWGTAADALVNSATLDPISEAGSVTKSLTGLDPMTTYYYQWTVTASGADPATSQVASFKTKGEVVFGDVTAGGLPSEGGVWASVDVEETGIAATTITCYCGETAESMTELETWSNVQTGDTLVATNTAAVWGTTYLFKFVSSFEYNNEIYTTETPAGNVKPVALDFLKTTASGDWMDGANWSLGIPPNDVISAAISNVTTMASLYLEDKDAVVKSLSIKNGKATVDLRGNASMTIGSITYGDKNIMNCDNGVLVTTGGVVTVNGNVAPEWTARTSQNKLEFCGTTATINGSISTATGNDSGGNNSVNVKLGSVLTITNGLTVSYTGTMIVDASIVTNRANLTVGNNAKQGTLTIRNGACFRQHWASSTGVGGKGEGTLNVLNGSTFDASGAAFYLGCDGDNSSTAGTLIVSNSTFKAAGFISPRHTQFKGLYKIDVFGENASFNVTGNAILGCVNMTASSYGTSGSTRMNVDGGSVTVGGTLNVGGGEFDRRNDYLTISGATASMKLGTLNCLTNAVVKFVVPEKGFENANIISATNRIQLAEGMPPITVDATECKNCVWVSLLAAEKGITNLTEENLASRVVLAEKDGHLTKGDRPYEFKLVTDSSGESPIVTALKFRVGSMGLAILIR